MNKTMTKQEALNRIKDIFNKDRWEFINQIDKDAIKIAYRVLEERVNEEKARTEIEPNMDRCHLIGTTYFIDTDEDANIYIYNGVRIIEKHKTSPVRYEVFCGKTPYVYLDLYDACKFIDNEYGIKCLEMEYDVVWVK